MYNSDCFHTTAKCVFWIVIRDANLELKFEIRYLWTVCSAKSLSRFVILRCASQITVTEVYFFSYDSRTFITAVHNQMCLNDLTSKSCFMGAELVWPSEPLPPIIPRAAYVQKHVGNASSMYMCVMCAVCTQTCLSPRWTVCTLIPWILFGSCVHCVIQNSQLLQIVCTLRNSRCAVLNHDSKLCTCTYAVVWKQSQTSQNVPVWHCFDISSLHHI